MTRKSLYPVARTVQLSCRLLDLCPQEVLRRAGLPQNHLVSEAHGVSARSFFSVWDAIAQLASDLDAPMRVARALAHQPSHAGIIAFSSSHDVRTGLKRAAVFKPLSAPIRLSLSETASGLKLSVGLTDPNQALPPFLGWLDIAFFTELCRHYSGRHIVPRQVRMPVAPPNRSGYEEYLGSPITLTREISMELTQEDAARPLLSENPELWRGLEPTLRQQLRDREVGLSMAERVEAALAELLPSGKAGADKVSAALGLSRRSMQRHLQEEGASFRCLLDRVREGLAMRYLREGNMSVPEISYLLAYRDPNSFYRAFQGWTGMTPGEARERISLSLPSQSSGELLGRVDVA